MSTCSAFEDEPPGWPDSAPSTIANASPRTMRHSLAIASLVDFPQRFQRQAPEVEVSSSFGPVLKAFRFADGQRFESAGFQEIVEGDDSRHGTSGTEVRRQKSEDRSQNPATRRVPGFLDFRIHEFQTQTYSIWFFGAPWWHHGKSL